MRLILSILMIAASIAGFVIFILPTYKNVQAMRAQESDYNQILSNARKLQEERNKLVQRYNSFDATQLGKLAVMLPENPNNVQLILQMDALARQNGLALQNVRIEETNETQTRGATVSANPNIGKLAINFSTVGPYAGFLEFIKSLETSLRIIDIQKIAFASTDDRPNYQYNVTVQSYWLK